LKTHQNAETSLM